MKSNIDNLNDIFSPLGSNQLRSADMFYWRNVYKEFIATGVNNSIDMWYEDILYGKINHKNMATVPAQASLKQLNSEKTVLAVKFVADAWEDFREHVRKSVIANEISKNSFYANLDPKSGWTSHKYVYNNWNLSMYGMFVSEFMTPSHEKRIVNFKDFIEVYIEFINTTSSSTPQTHEALILSHWCPPTISGLIVEIASGAYDYDLIKVKLLHDESYNRVSSIAHQYGFKVDQNAPWRFVADLDSDGMKKYMSTYGLDSKKNVYDSLYSNTYALVRTTFVNHLVDWYNLYIYDNPFVSEIASRSCNNASIPIYQYGSSTPLVQAREAINYSDAQSKFSDEYWIRLYAYVRARESRKNWAQSKFNNVVSKTISLSKIKNWDSAMYYLYRELEGNKKKKKDVRNDFTEEEINAIVSKGKKRRRGTFKF